MALSTDTQRKLYAELLNTCQYAPHLGGVRPFKNLMAAKPFVSDDAFRILLRGIADKILRSPGTHVSTELIVSVLAEAGELENEIDLLLPALRDGYKDLPPETRARIKSIGKHFQLPSLGDLPDLNAREQKILRVPWKLADAVYFANKGACYEKLREYGVDLESKKRRFPSFLPFRERCVPILTAMLRSRVEIDRSMLSEYEDVAPYVEDHVRERMTAELGALLEDMKEVAKYHTKDMPGEDEWARVLGIFFQDIEQFFDGFVDKVPSVRPLQHWVEALAKFKGVTHMSKYEIHGSQVLIAESGSVVTQINGALLNQPGKKELAEAFALLRADISQLPNLPGNKKQQVLSTVRDAEAEAAQEKPSQGVLKSYLSSITEIMKSGGEMFDEAVGWGGRLAKIAALIGLGSVAF